MLARRLITILPAMTLAEAIKTTRIHRVAGLTGDQTALVTTRPCRAPHHTISDVGVISGGQVPTPGDVSLAHHGVRCLDERPACRRQASRTWCQPLEESVTKIQSRGRPRLRRPGCDRRPARDTGKLEGTTIVPNTDVLAYGSPRLKNSC
jgi:magnesium chelatase family protein